MKQLKFISPIILLIILLACQPVVTFNEPQPANTDNITTFPKRMQGKYISLSDSSLLLVSDKLILSIYGFDEKIHTHQLDASSKLSGDTVINLITNERKTIKRDGDSIIMNINYTDTLFEMNYDNVVRKFKGCFFLNTRYDKANWEVKKVQFTRGKLIISKISTSEDIANLKNIVEMPQDTATSHTFSVTKKQFKTFIKNGGFADYQIYIKQQ